MKTIIILALVFNSLMASAALDVLSQAVKDKDAVKVSSLLDSGSKTNFINEEGTTPLIIASGDGSEEIVKLLIAHGASPLLRRSEDHQLPLHIASLNGHLNVVKLLQAAGSPLNSYVHYENLKAIDYSVIGGHLDIYLYFKDQGSKLNRHPGFLLTKNKCIPENVAGKNDLINFFVKAGQSFKHPQLVFLTIESGCDSLVGPMASQGMDLTEMDEDDRKSAMVYFFKLNPKGEHEKLLIELIKAGAPILEPYWRDEMISYPARYAATSGNMEILNLLLAKGLDKKYLSVGLAINGKQEAMVDYLLSIGVSATDAIPSALGNNSLLYLKKLLAYKPDLEKCYEKISCLHIAIDAKENSVSDDVIIELIKAGADVYRTFVFQDYGSRELFPTSLGLALAHHRWEVAKYLINNGYDINFQEPKTKKSTLHFLASCGPKEEFACPSLEAFKFFLAYKPNVELQDSYGLTPIFKINLKSDLEKLKALKSLGNANLDARDKYGSPFFFSMYYSYNFSDEALKYLVSQKVNLKAKDLSGNTILHRLQDLSTFQAYVAAGADYKQVNNDKIAPLHYYSMNGYDELVKYYISSHLDLDPITAEGLSPLLYAIDRYHFELATNLILAGAKIRGSKELLLAFKYSSSEPSWKVMIDTLLKKGATVTGTNPDGKTLLHLLVSFEIDDQDLVKGIIHNGEAMNIQDKNGRTPLMYALDKRQENLVQQFMKYKQDLTLQDYQNKTLLFYAENMANLETFLKMGITDLDHLDAQDESFLSSLTCNLYEGANEKIAMVTLLLKKGANPNNKCRYGDHPIDRLVEKNLTDLFNLFISYKADPFVFDEYGNNLLISASEVEMLKTLLALGLDVNHQNKAKETPIFKACEYRTLEIVKTLIEAGANPLLRDHYNTLPIDRVHPDKLEIIQIMKKAMQDWGAVLNN